MLLHPPSSQKISVQLSVDKVLKLQEIWHAVAKLPASRCGDAMKVFLHELGQLIGAHDVSWVAIKKLESPLKRSAAHHEIYDMLNGWYPVGAIYLSPQKDLNSTVSRWYRGVRKHGLDSMTKYTIKDRGVPRAISSTDYLKENDQSEDWRVQEYLALFNVGQRLSCINVPTQHIETYIMIDRPVGAAPFSEEDRLLAFQASMGIQNLHRLALYERGLLHCDQPLSQREQETYRLLLSDLSESEIATEMKLSTHTVHDYSKKLYQKFQVRGRAGLMAMVLGQ